MTQTHTNTHTHTLWAACKFAFGDPTTHRGNTLIRALSSSSLTRREHGRCLFCHTPCLHAVVVFSWDAYVQTCVFSFGTHPNDATIYYCYYRALWAIIRIGNKNQDDERKVRKLISEGETKEIVQAATVCKQGHSSEDEPCAEWKQRRMIKRKVVSSRYVVGVLGHLWQLIRT
mmetsp:Transcript_30177/g.42116  ORF Transcript_30177/g.42116 Transcript_30177/m.42116 type:complete len:173 (+) Transcript_30177:367-885(+)